jgi:hypothetical protein
MTVQGKAMLNSRISVPPRSTTISESWSDPTFVTLILYIPRNVGGILCWVHFKREGRPINLGNVKV